MKVQLPFVDGEFYECTQNSNDTPTHGFASTLYDLDFYMPVGTIVVAAAAGHVRIHPDETKTGGFGWFIQLDHDGSNTWSIYGHLSGFIATEGQHVVAGQPIAYSGGRPKAPGAGTSTGPHLHFGVHTGTGVGVSQPMAVYGLDRSTGILGWYSTGMSSEFVCAIYSADGKTKIAAGHNYESRPVGVVFGDYQCRQLTDGTRLCWQHPQSLDPSCSDGMNLVWYHKNGEGAFRSDPGFYSQCNELLAGQSSIFAYLDGGFGVGGVGPGIETEATDDLPDPPDFVVKKVWLTTPWGTETYKFGLGETFDTKAQSANIGDGPCLSTDVTQTITGHFYLSRGYKEDAHSGTDAWRRIDSTTTQCTSLMPGDTHTETKNTVLSQWITTPGIYNIVYCIDHPLDDHNNGGEHGEKHESNNCSTEAVFEVTANQVENVPDVDFTVSGFTVLQSPVYAGDYIRLGAWITNAGTVNATADIRSSYTVSCNGGPMSVLTDDGTMASTLTAGANAWEEIQTPVLMPNVAGTCTLTFTADYLGAQLETDEANNSMSLTVTLAPRPAPVLSITRFEDKVGCCTTNTGAAPKPRIWVYNSGTAAPGANVTVVYQVSSPVATGGLYQVIGYGTIEPRELPPGTSDEDQMDCDGCWRIPTTSAWKKQWHNFRACLRVDGGTPVPSTGAPSPGEVCAVYQRYSKS